MILLSVHGPFRITYEKRKGGRTLIFDDFWSKDGDAHHLAEERGCYIFQYVIEDGHLSTSVKQQSHLIKERSM